MKEKDYLLWLSNVDGIGSRTLEKLLDLFGSAENIFSISPEKLEAKGINKDIIHNIVQNRDLKYIDNILKNLSQKSIDVLTKYEEEYPENLKSIYDPPFLIYKKGTISNIDQNAVAIVGSRKASPYGKWVAYKLANELARKGVTIISGMAYGIDTAAHKGAIDGGGRTIAVLGCGVDICYPKSNNNLMRSICMSGSVISEYGVGVEPIPGHFPARNRIISGLSKGIIIVEAAEKSGSLITAEFALEQGREVFAVPGNINSNLSKGTNKLIKDGAKLITSIDDVLEDLDITLKEEKEYNTVQLSELEKSICRYITDKQPVPLDFLINDLRTNIGQISSIITILELKGLIEQLPGKILIMK